MIGVVALFMKFLAAPPEPRTPPSIDDQGMVGLTSVVLPGILEEIRSVPEAKPAKPPRNFSVEPTPRRTHSKPEEASKPIPDPLHVTHYSPKPARLQEGPRIQENGLTVRGLRLGTPLTEVREQFGVPQRTRTEEIGKHYARARTTTLDYQGYFAMFDKQGVMGSAGGDGLERFGIPILASGDGPNEVFAVLGPPDRAGYPYFGRKTEAEWTYHYEGFELTIRFLNDEVTRFYISESDFRDSFC